VLAIVRVPLDDAQFGALASFAFNLGVPNLRASTLLKKLNEGDYAGASAEFARWVRAGGRVLSGLVERRNAECEFFLAGNASDALIAEMRVARTNARARTFAGQDPKAAYAPVA
jgi:GH24 family phage-related lysozyme (muramidase)